jgi:hypothetical protein
MVKKQVNFKLPPDLIETLDVKADNEGTTRTELVIQGIRYILGLPGIQTNSVDNRIYSRIETLEARLHQIETHRIDAGIDDYRVNCLEERVSQLESQRVEIDIRDRLHTLAEQVQSLSDCLARIQEQKGSTVEVGHSISLEPSTTSNQPLKLTLTELAKRLGVDRSNLAKVRKNKTAIELAVYTKERDPNGVAWQFDEAEEAFKPVENEVTRKSHKP